MKIYQVRVANVHKPCSYRAYCISHVYIDGQYSHDVIEDYDRGLSSDMTLAMIAEKKIYGKTAIPVGTYKVVMDVRSPKFYKKEYYKDFCNGYLPRLLNVPGYEGILIHCGIDENSSAGCLIVGENKVVGKVINSKATFERIWKKLKEAWDRRETITYQIERKFKV